MSQNHKIEIFSAGCPLCQHTVDMVKSMTQPNDDIRILDMNDPAITRRAQMLGVGSVPAVAVDGKLANCCAGRGPDEAMLKAAIGK